MHFIISFKLYIFCTHAIRSEKRILQILFNLNHDQLDKPCVFLKVNAIWKHLSYLRWATEVFSDERIVIFFLSWYTMNLKSRKLRINILAWNEGKTCRRKTTALAFEEKTNPRRLLQIFLEAKDAHINTFSLPVFFPLGNARGGEEKYLEKVVYLKVARSLSRSQLPRYLSIAHS